MIVAKVAIMLVSLFVLRTIVMAI